MLRFIVAPLFLVSSMAISQPLFTLPMEDGKVTFSRVIELEDSFTENDIYSLVKEFIATNNKSFNRQNSESHFSGKDILWGLEKKGGENVELLFKNDNPLKVDVTNERVAAKGIFKGISKN